MKSDSDAMVVRLEGTVKGVLLPRWAGCRLMEVMAFVHGYEDIMMAGGVGSKYRVEGGEEGDDGEEEGRKREGKREMTDGSGNRPWGS